MTLSRPELKRRKRALLGSPTGRGLVTLNSAIAYQLDLVNKGKRPMGMSAHELGHMLHEFLVAMAHVRDTYVDERCPK